MHPAAPRSVRSTTAGVHESITTLRAVYGPTGTKPATSPMLSYYAPHAELRLDEHSSASVAHPPGSYYAATFQQPTWSVRTVPLRQGRRTTSHNFA